MKNLLEEKETFKQIVNDVGRLPTHPDGFTHTWAENFFEKSS